MLVMYSSILNPYERNDGKRSQQNEWKTLLQMGGHDCGGEQGQDTGDFSLPFKSHLQSAINEKMFSSRLAVTFGDRQNEAT